MAPPEARIHSRSDPVTVVVTGSAVDGVFDVLENDDCRRILQATGGEPLTVNELSRRCDIPLSTVYRKVDLLAGVDLLEERVRLRPTGKHTSEYHRCVDSIEVSVDATDGFNLRLGRATCVRGASP